MSASMQWDLIPGRAVVRVFAHTLPTQRGPVACHSWVTNGLLGFGQREIVLTMVRHPNAGIEHAPQEPVQFLRTIAGFAQQGRLVDEGGITELGPTGLFGRPSIRGLVYQTAWPMDGVVIPNGSLHAVVLVGHEMETAKRYGSLRVLAGRSRALSDGAVVRSGSPAALFTGSREHPRRRCRRDHARRQRHPRRRANRRAPSARDASATRRVRASSARCGARVLHDDRYRVRRVPRLVSRTERTGSDLRARQLRTPPWLSSHRPQQAYDGANPFEDGFAAMLTDASWARVRQSLMSGEPVTIAGNKPLVLEWFDAVAARREVPAVSDMQMHLRENQADIEARLGMNALVDYANAIEKTVQQHFAGQNGPGSTLDLEVILSAGRPPQIRIGDAGIFQKLSAIAAPPVRAGDIAFRGSFALFGGPS
jgi:hypothetical protein